jgi:hypothetical protein
MMSWFRNPVVVAVVSLALSTALLFGILRSMHTPRERHMRAGQTSIIEVSQLTPNTTCNTHGVCTLRDIMAWDLRRVVPVRPEEVKADKVSPAHFINYLHMVRRRPEQTTMCAHYSTSGHSIDFNIVTHTAIRGIEHLRNVNSRHEAQHHEQYALELDISSEPVGHEFLVIIEGIYWNGFRQPTETAETYSDDESLDGGELSVLVVFPPQSPPSNIARTEINDATEQRAEYRGLEIFPDGHERYIFWSIRTPRSGYHYELKWDWVLRSR